MPPHHYQVGVSPRGHCPTSYHQPRLLCDAVTETGAAIRVAKDSSPSQSHKDATVCWCCCCFMLLLLLLLLLTSSESRHPKTDSLSPGGIDQISPVAIQILVYNEMSAKEYPSLYTWTFLHSTATGCYPDNDWSLFKCKEVRVNREMWDIFNTFVSISTVRCL